MAWSICDFWYGEIVLTEIQIEGKKKMKASEYLNGLQDKNSIIGKIFE